MNVVALYELYITRLFEFGVIDSCLPTKFRRFDIAPLVN